MGKGGESGEQDYGICLPDNCCCAVEPGLATTALLLMAVNFAVVVFAGLSVWAIGAATIILPHCHPAETRCFAMTAIGRRRVPAG